MAQGLPGSKSARQSPYKPSANLMRPTKASAAKLTKTIGQGLVNKIKSHTRSRSDLNFQSKSPIRSLTPQQVRKNEAPISQRIKRQFNAPNNDLGIDMFHHEAVS